MKRTAFRIATEIEEQTGQRMVVVGWNRAMADKVMTFGDEMAFATEEDFVALVEDAVSFVALSHLIDAQTRDRLKRILDNDY